MDVPQNGLAKATWPLHPMLPFFHLAVQHDHLLFALAQQEARRSVHRLYYHYFVKAVVRLAYALPRGPGMLQFAEFLA